MAGVADTKIIAHRGGIWRDIRQNSREAFEKAADSGVDGIEFDLRQSADNQVICLHDSEAKGKKVADMTISEIEEKFGFQPLSLVETLELIPDSLIAIAEIKEEGYIQEVAKEVGVRDNWQIISFQDQVVTEISKTNPDHAGLIIGDDLSQLSFKEAVSEVFPKKRISEIGVGRVVIHEVLARLGGLRYPGVKNSVWGVQARHSIGRYLRDDRVDQIITDSPEIALEVRGVLTN